MIKSLSDMIFSLLLLVLLLPALLFVAFLVKLTSKGPILYTSKRVGINNSIFLMPKFRTMRVDTPEVATHLLSDPKSFLTPIGDFLRKSSLDEIPQLFSIISGEMSFVGPRPALFNQDDLIALRTEKNLHLVKPGITGWAQINGRDEISIPEKVKLDEYYCKRQSLFFDYKIIFLTIYRVIFRSNITH